MSSATARSQQRAPCAGRGGLGGQLLPRRPAAPAGIGRAEPDDKAVADRGRHPDRAGDLVGILGARIAGTTLARPSLRVVLEAGWPCCHRPRRSTRPYFRHLTHPARPNSRFVVPSEDCWRDNRCRPHGRLLEAPCAKSPAAYALSTRPAAPLYWRCALVLPQRSPRWDWPWQAKSAAGTH